MSIESFIGNEVKVMVGAVENGASDVLHFLTGAATVAEKVVKASPQVVAALGVLSAGIQKLLTDASTQPFSAQELADIKAVWPEVQAFATSLGLKL